MKTMREKMSKFFEKNAFDQVPVSLTFPGGIAPNAEKEQEFFHELAFMIAAYAYSESDDPIRFFGALTANIIGHLNQITEDYNECSDGDDFDCDDCCCTPTHTNH